MQDKIVFFSDLIGQELSDYVLCECYFIVKQISHQVKKAENAVLVINSNSTQLYCSDPGAIEFLKRLFCYSGKSIRIDDIMIRKRLVLLNKNTGLGFFFHGDASKVKIFNQTEILNMIESDEDVFRWERVDKT